MRLVLQVHLKVGHRRIRPGRVRLAGTVAAANARQPGELNVWRDGAVRASPPGQRQRHGRVGVGVDGAVAHDGFERVVRVGLEEVRQGGEEPVGGRGLRWEVSILS